MGNALNTAALSLLLVLNGCGGGGTGDAPAAAAAAPSAPAGGAGLWIGTLATGQTLQAIVFSDGSYSFIYSESGASGDLAGTAQGTGMATAGAFASTSVRKYNFDGSGVVSASVSASYVPRQSFAGSLTDSLGRSAAFTTAYSAAFENVPTLRSLAGVYKGRFNSTIGAFDASISVSASGQISAVNGGCQLVGTVVARSDGNAFQLAVSFGGPPCVLANQAFSGVAYIDPSTKRLIGISSDSAHTIGLAFVGSKT